MLHGPSHGMWHSDCIGSVSWRHARCSAIPHRAPPCLLVRMCRCVSFVMVSYMHGCNRAHIAHVDTEEELVYFKYRYL